MPLLRPRKDTLLQSPSAQTNVEVGLKCQGPVLWQLSKRKRCREGYPYDFPPLGIDAFPPIPYERKQKLHKGEDDAAVYMKEKGRQEEGEEETMSDAPDTCQRLQKKGRIQKSISKEPMKRNRTRNRRKKAKGKRLSKKSSTKKTEEMPDNLDLVAPGAILALPHKAVEADSLGRENPVWAFYKATVISTKATKRPNQLEIKFCWKDGSGRGKQIVDGNNMRSGKKMYRSMRRKAGKCEHNKKAKTSWGCVKPARTEGSF